MWFVNNIITYCNSITDYFYSIYLEVIGWIYPFWYAAGFFYQLCLLFNNLAWAFYDFGQWVGDVNRSVTNILSFTDIYYWFQSYFYAAANAWNWVQGAVSRIAEVVDSWWSSAQYTVQSWIDEAKQWAGARIAGIEALVSDILAWWNNFKYKIPSIDEIISWFTNWWSNVIATIINWGALTGLEIDSLIGSWFKSFEPFWEGWQDWRDSIIEFIQDPWQWLYGRAEELFDRFW